MSSHSHLETARVVSFSSSFSVLSPFSQIRFDNSMVMLYGNAVQDFNGVVTCYNKVQ